ncbi:hypothetical protein CHLRE_13g567426v5 [Chlamydomonas reinhardtii]|uniref:Uncharacterized protein n=1 Tax=Chlamydomonas reinhardtii TaxID=3055 RepID=A0A2K3CZF2_CHLRE|nr:uncharacterized protein CHLRE_13g567426v5 [Chlamydomonas reinhardtii]PNW73657.1 hypothetical protein CHLRE_13g567426v5 [Chlamydomonas reinhardtii]
MASASRSKSVVYWCLSVRLKAHRRGVDGGRAGRRQRGAGGRWLLARMASFVLDE